ncbi:MICOS complex subunit MIC27 [Halichoeres trimaculatus]|uniref:MICOS complex subunit MIC27 n=1 Tax=Halichoeres trimaculatus TaxID=147232 RepID=UPI003D9F16A2
MAAKVALVAVPTVLGIASIRVYTISEAPTDGLITREKLNIYTPLPQSDTAQFVPEDPGFIQRGLTTAREGVLPFALAVKGACVSVKTGTVNLYHAGEDVFYYLKDPPPGFLPRFGTITMAGLLGMFLARKGSRFKRVAVPMGLMSVGASLCYPAQAVGVLKVTGKKVYAVGQWSGAAVSSLLASKPQEPVAKEVTASQPEVAPVPNPESEAPQADSVSEKEAESVLPVPVSEEPIVAVVTDEVSSVTLTELSQDQTTTEANTDPVAHSVPAETELTITSEEVPPPIESDTLVTKQAAEDTSTDISTAEPAPSLGSEEVAPVESAPAEPAPAESVPAEPAPAEPAPAESVQGEAALVESAPSQSVPAEGAPVDSVPPSEELPAPKASDEPLVPGVEPPETTTAAVEETPTPPTPPQPAAENNKGGSGFKPDPALMDFGQSSPEDEDLYSTRS